MVTLQLELPDDLQSRLAARAAEDGFGSVEQFAAALLHAAAKAVPDGELEQTLAGRAEDPRPGIDYTPEFAEQFRRRVRERRDSNGARP